MQKLSDKPETLTAPAPAPARTAKVAVIRTTPETVVSDYGRAMRLAEYDKVLRKDRDTALKINISWHHFYPACSTTPWQLDGVIRTMLEDGYSKDLIHGCHNRTVVVSAKWGEVNNKQKQVVVGRHGLRNVHLYEGEEWITYEPKSRMRVLPEIFPRGILIPKRFLGENIVHLPTVKCVHPDTEIVMADGSLRRVADVVEAALGHGIPEIERDGDVRVQAPGGLLSLKDDGTLAAQGVRWFWRTPVNGHPLMRVRTKTGREVKVSLEHPFLTPGGWRRAAELKGGDRIAIPRRLGIAGGRQKLPPLRREYGRTSTRWIRLPEKTSTEFWRWMGYVMAEGWVQPMRTTCRFWWSNQDPLIVEDFVTLTEMLFGIEVTTRRDNPTDHYFDSVQLREFFESLGLPIPLDAGNKRVPALLFRCPAEEIAAFLQGYFDGDAGVGKKDGLRVVTKSERLAADVQHLLNRLGVISFRGSAKGRPRKNLPYRPYHAISVYGDELVELSRHMRLRSKEKQRRIEALVARRCASKRPSNWDTIPVSPDLFRTVREGLGVTHAATGRPSSVNNIENGYTEPTRPVMQQMMGVFRARDTSNLFAEQLAALEFLTRDDIAWDHVELVEEIPSDTTYLYDFTMEEAPSFVGNGVLLHNTHVFTTMTGAMKNAFGGLLHERRHWTHSVIHETLVDLLAIQKEIHAGIFAVMDGTLAGDGPGPRCMTFHEKDLILASADQVAIDAVAARMMGFDPMDLRFIRLAHEDGLGVGDIDRIEIVGEDPDWVRKQNWGFRGNENTFASRGQKMIYWGPLKPLEKFLLRTALAPWAYLASIAYHDLYWYLFVGRSRVRQALQTKWGRLFQSY